MKVYAFVGPSGSGKSYRAQMVAGKNNISYIIDDGLLIKGNTVVAGTSAKKAATRIETVKQALFMEEHQRKDMIKAIKKQKPGSLMILGTSDEMVHKIAENLELPEIKKIIYIEDVASEEEITKARSIRKSQGKHVIPVPTFEIKKEFSGYILDPLQIFQSNGRGKPSVSEKSITRPTFSYIGNFTISDRVFKQIAEDIANKNKGIARVIKLRVDNTPIGASVYMEVAIYYGYNIYDIAKEFKKQYTEIVENLTQMVVHDCEIYAKQIVIE